MKQVLYLLSILILTSLLLTNCQKYEDGPFISLKTKQARLIGKWSLSSQERDGVDKMAAFEGSVTYEFSEESVKILTEEDNNTAGYNNFLENGTWLFSNTKESLVISLTSAQKQKTSEDIWESDTDYKFNADIWIITRLTSREFWFERIYAGKKEILKLKKIGV